MYQQNPRIRINFTRYKWKLKEDHSVTEVIKWLRINLIMKVRVRNGSKLKLFKKIDN